MAEHVRHAGKGNADLRREQVLHRRAAALVRHVVELDARERVEERADQVLGAAVARAREVDLAGLRLRQRDQLAHRARGRLLRIHDQHVRTGGDHR